MYSLKLKHCRYTYKDEFNELPQDEKQKVEAEFRETTLDSFQDVLKGEVKSYFFSYILEYISFLAGFKIKMRCIRGQASLSCSSISI